MKIRRAELKDAPALASLVYQSAQTLLSVTFNLSPLLSALNFLPRSFCQPHGQYGYHNHWVVEVDQKVVACVSAWHTELDQSFHQATMQSITDFFGPETLLDIMLKNELIEACVPAVKEDEWCIGHLSVVEDYQRQGIAKTLIEHMQVLALEKGKSYLSLDVEVTNEPAIALYTKLGFMKVSQSSINEKMQALKIGQHLHLRLGLI